MRNNRLVRFGLTVALLAFGGDPALAAEAQTANSTRSTTPTSEDGGETGRVDQEPPTTDSTKQSSKSANNDSVFRPSEDISEDLAVPFPVDI